MGPVTVVLARRRLGLLALGGIALLAGLTGALAEFRFEPPVVRNPIVDTR